MSTGFRHDAGLFASTEEMLGVVVPFLDEATALGIPAVVRLGDGLAARVRDRVAQPAQVDFVDGGDVLNPVKAVRAMHELAQGHLDAGAEQIRLLGGASTKALSSATGCEQWARYEAALNEVWAELPLWALCCYFSPPGSRLTDDVLATHPGLVRDSEWQESPAYVEPRRFVAGRDPASAERLEAGSPAVELHDPSLADARDAVRRLAVRAGFATDAVDDLVVGVNEIVTNAFRHGRPPVSVRGWVEGGEVLVAVRDAGAGTDEPFLGLVAPRGERAEPGGYGIWLARQCSDLVSFRRDPDGLTVRIAAGAG
jgi:anti-sigma regulatory factor (Ser/Thr protein kinase)